MSINNNSSYQNYMYTSLSEQTYFWLSLVSQTTCTLTRTITPGKLLYHQYIVSPSGLVPGSTLFLAQEGSKGNHPLSSRKYIWERETINLMRSAVLQSPPLNVLLKVTKAQFKRRIFHASNQIPIWVDLNLLNWPTRMRRATFVKYTLFVLFVFRFRLSPSLVLVLLLWRGQQT